MHNRFIYLPLFCLLLLFSGCSVAPKHTAPMTPQIPVTPWTTIDVYYGTNRLATGEVGPNNVYGKDFGELQYGKCQVSIPENHAPGEIERPQWYKFEFSEDPVKHVTIRTLSALSQNDFNTLFQQSLDEHSAEDILIFIHGFSNTFDEAVRRTGQLSYDLGFPGVTMTYSWPSQGSFSISNYHQDEEFAKRSIPYLKEFLLSVVEQSAGKKINVIAHSMGNRLLTNAIAEIEETSPKTIFHQIILAAPDVNAEVFKNEIFPRMKDKAEQVTLYASSEDKALMASRILHDRSRLGESGEFLTVVDGMDTIDSTGVDPSTLGHSYFSSTQTLLEDIHELVMNNMEPQHRGLHVVKDKSRNYWKMFLE